MRAPLTIVIPTLNAGRDLAGALTALMEGVEAGLVRELIVSDGGSNDDTLAMVQDAGAIVVSGEAGRGGQLARGAAAAAGEWLLFVHADSWLTPGWDTVVAAFMATGEEKAAVFRLAFRAPGPGAKMVAGWANLRTRVFGLPYGDQGLLISRVLYDQIGGFEDIPLMEDVAMARALHGRIRLLDAVIATGAGRYLSGGWIRRGARNMVTLLRYLAGGDPKRLVKGYESHGHDFATKNRDS